MWWKAIPIIGDIIGNTFDLIDKTIEDKDEANKIKATIDQAYRQADLTKFTNQIKSQANIVITEASGQSWLQRNWRPGLMALFGVIIANNYILNPWLSAMLNINVTMDIPPDMWALLKLGVGGYVVGRTAEKGIKYWKGQP